VHGGEDETAVMELHLRNLVSLKSQRLEVCIVIKEFWECIALNLLRFFHEVHFVHPIVVWHAELESYTSEHKYEW
jgi:hypothetical protein